MFRAERPANLVAAAIIAIGTGGRMNQADPLKKMRILVENRHGALLKIVGVFTTRAYNIITLNVMPDEDEELSQMTVSLRCSDVRFDQLRKQLIKIVDVVDVVEEEQTRENAEIGGKKDGENLLRAGR
jgi:acetolactate synthase regulatory subunit